eukprot:SAG11_NODE_798_length_7127_cov_8.227803_2_plen_130_part_00
MRRCSDYRFREPVVERFRFPQPYSPVPTAVTGESSDNDGGDGGSSGIVLEEDAESLIVELGGAVYCVQRENREVFGVGRSSSKPEIVGKWDGNSCIYVVPISIRKWDEIATCNCSWARLLFFYQKLRKI